MKFSMSWPLTCRIRSISTAEPVACTNPRIHTARRSPQRTCTDCKSRDCSGPRRNHKTLGPHVPGLLEKAASCHHVNVPRTDGAQCGCHVSGLSGGFPWSVDCGLCSGVGSRSNFHHISTTSILQVSGCLRRRRNFRIDVGRCLNTESMNACSATFSPCPATRCNQ